MGAAGSVHKMAEEEKGPHMQMLADQTGLSVDEIRVMAEQFDKADKNGTGKITLSELCAVYSLKGSWWYFDVDAQYKAIDEMTLADGSIEGPKNEIDHELTFDEFVTNRACHAKASKLGLEPRLVMKIHVAYDGLDKNDDGKVKAGEFNKSKVGMEFALADTDDDEQLDFDELLRIMAKKEGVAVGEPPAPAEAPA